MNTMRLAIALGIATLTASAGFLACSSDDSSVPGGDASTDGTLDAGSQPDTGDPDPEEDAGADAQQGISDPGLVSCGDNTCNVPAQFCCIRPDSGAQTCNDPGGGGGRDGGGGGACTNGTRVTCDEAADCAEAGAARVCCVRLAGGFGGNGQVGNLCQTRGACGNIFFGAGRHACKSDGDCAEAGADAGTCVAQSCRGRTVRTCGGFPVDDAGLAVGCN